MGKTHESLLWVITASLIQVMAMVMPKPNGTHLDYQVELGCTPVILTLRKSRKEDQQLKAILLCRVSLKLGWDMKS